MTITDLEKLPADLRETIVAGHEGAVGVFKLKYKKIHENAKRLIDIRVVMALVRLNYTDAQIIEIFTEPAFGIGTRYRREADTKKYMDGLFDDAKRRLYFEKLEKEGEISKFTYLKKIHESAEKARSIFPCLEHVPDNEASVILEGGTLYPYDDRTPRPIMDVRVARVLFRCGVNEEDIRAIFTSTEMGVSETYFRALLEGMGEVYLDRLVASAKAWTEFELVWKKLYYEILGERD